jgi:hypothetical protein
MLRKITQRIPEQGHRNSSCFRRDANQLPKSHRRFEFPRSKNARDMRHRHVQMFSGEAQFFVEEFLSVGPNCRRRDLGTLLSVCRSVAIFLVYYCTMNQHLKLINQSALTS